MLTGFQSGPDGNPENQGLPPMAAVGGGSRLGVGVLSTVVDRKGQKSLLESGGRIR